MEKSGSKCRASRKKRFAEKPVQRNAANARERGRMRILSKAFSRLKTTLPWVPNDTKLSKLDTLRFAAKYIAHLKETLNDETNCQPQVTSPPSARLSWTSITQQSKETTVQQRPPTQTGRAPASSHFDAPSLQLPALPHERYQSRPSVPYYQPRTEFC